MCSSRTFSSINLLGLKRKKHSSNFHERFWGIRVIFRTIRIIVATLFLQCGRMSKTTHFVTFDVSDLYTMIPRNGAIEALARFLTKHSKNGAIGNLKIDTILRLARLVLDTNCFVYDTKYYKQIRDGAMGSPFTMVLANIDMPEWEHRLIERQQRHNELYGR